MNTTEEKPIGNAFDALLRNQRKGLLAGDLSEALQKLTLACASVGKAGKLTLSITITPSGDAMTVADDIKVKLPEANKSQSIFYATEDGRLVRDNPDQKTLDLKVIEPPKAVATAVQAVS